MTGFFKNPVCDDAVYMEPEALVRKSSVSLIGELIVAQTYPLPLGLSLIGFENEGEKVSLFPAVVWACHATIWVGTGVEAVTSSKDGWKGEYSIYLFILSVHHYYIG